MSYSTDRSNDPNIVPWKLAAVRRVDGVTGRHLCAGFHAITAAVATASIRDLRLDPAKVTVIPRGRDRERLGENTLDRRTRVRAELGLVGDQPMVLNVGRQEFQKDQATLLRAANLLRHDRPDLVVLIAGREGNATPELRRLVDELALGDTVRFLGFTTEVPDLLVAADAFAFPSRFEGLGGSVLEAMCLQVPIVATDIPALSEVLDRGARGSLVPVGTPVALAAGLDHTLDRGRDVIEKVDAASAAFDQEYELGHVATRMAEWFASLVERPIR